VAEEDFVLTPPRLLAVCAVLVLAIVMLIAPVVAALSVVESNALPGPAARFDQIPGLGIFLQVGRFPVFLLLAVWLARSPNEQ